MSNRSSAGASPVGAHAIAIVGMGARFAGAPDLAAYWALTRDGRDAFGPVPADRWPHEAFFDENRRATDRSYAPKGGFIDDVRSFPALHLGIPPRRVEVMDPQQRLSIEVALQAIEDSGRRPDQLPRRTGVFVGVTANEFRMLLSSRVVASLMAAGVLGDAPADPGSVARAVSRVVPSRPFTAPGALTNMVAAAVAQELDLHGPAYTVDAACASAMMAVADAVHQLRAGAIDAAVAGGVYLQLTPENYVAFSRIGAISGTGRCLPFDARADGFVQGDGAGMLVLRRLADALADGDRVYAVLDGIGINNDGRGDGPMAPVLSGQVACIEDAWRDSGQDPARLGYVEAHGTGTDVGDGIELTGLRTALGGRAVDVKLGSSKANVGHTMSAAGVAGLIRAALALHHRTIPPLAGFESAKPELELDGGPFRVPRAAEPWTTNLVAAVSSFGFGGTNGHAVLSAAPAPHPVPQLDGRRAQPELVRLSAGTEADLRTTAARLAAALDADPALTPAAVARTWAPRPSLRHRASLVAADRAELRSQLEALASGGKAAGLVTAAAPAKAPTVALLFPGQGAQRPGMLAALRDRFPVVADAVSAAELDVTDLLNLPLSHLLWPDRRAAAVAPDVAAAELTATEHCQPALVAAGLAAWRLLEQVGVRPAVVGGHSLGEFAAAAVGGVLSPRDAVRFAALRGAAMARVPGDPGAMAAVMAAAEVVRPLLPPGVVVANDNHPRQVVISGPTPAVADAGRAAAAAGLEVVPLTVSHAFHSPLFAELPADEWLAQITVRDPSGPAVASCIADRPYAGRGDALAVFRRHAASPVDFRGLLRQCVELGADLFVQVGAGGPLSSFARQVVGAEARAVLTLASMDDADGGRSALETLGQLWLHGVELDTTGVTGPAALASLPPIALPREPYWPIKDDAQPALKLAAVTAAPARVAAAEPAEVAPATPTQDEVLDKVAAVVARVSSYPLSSLRPEQTLTDDLGFDSLMVTDLATGLADAFPGLGGLPQELLLGKPSVADLAAYVKSAQSGEAAATDDDAPLRAYRPTWRHCPLPEPVKVTGTALAGRVVLVTGDRDDEVTAALKQAGATVTRRAQAAVELVVHTAPFEDPVPVHAVVAGEADLPDRGGRLAKIVEDVVAAGGRPGVLVSCRDDDPWAHGELGVARALAREWPDRVSKAVQFSGIDGSFRAARLIQELLSTDRTVDVRWSPEGRQIAGQEPFELAPGWVPAEGARVVVTGGTRGIGARVAEELVARGVHVVVVGRGAPERELAPGFHTVVQADVTDRAALVAALAPHGPYDAAIHAAGTLADGAVGSVPADVAQLARRVKVDGLVNLLAATRAPRTLALGSWAGRFGNRHQLHYSVANAAMSGLAEHAPGVVVAETGPWSGSAMAKTIPAPIAAAMRAEGVDFVGDRVGVEALLADLGASGPVVHGRRVPWWSRARTVSVTMSVESHPWLADHAINGKPVLPLAAAADLLAWAADPGPAFELSDLTLFQGVVVERPVALTLTIRGDRAELRVVEGAASRLAYRARVVPLPSPAVPAPAPSTGGSPPTLDAPRFYADGLTFHGPRFQGMERVEAVGDDFVRGRVKVARLKSWIPESTREAWAVDPLALDSAFQLAALVAWQRYQRAGTPVALRRLVVVAPFKGPLSVDARFAEPQGDRFEASFVLRAADGSLVALAEGAVADLQQKSDDAGFEPKREWVDPLAWQELKDLDQRLEAAVLLGIPNPYFHVHEGTARNVTTVAGRQLVNFSSYNYLGLSGDPRVLDEVERAARKYGTSVSASRVASGERPFHRALEAELAEAQGVDDALVFTAGHMTNVNVVGHLMKPPDLVLHDELAHDSLLQGIKLSGAGRRAFRHEDPEHLERLLRDLRKHHQKCLIVVEGVYSMDGDLCHLSEYVRLKKKYGCLLMVDEAHSFGVCGPRGCGIGEHWKVTAGVDPRDVDIWMGTLSKSLASCGGWVGGSAGLIRYLRYTAPGFVYSAGITPANGVAALTSLRLMLQEPWRVAKLQANAKRFHDALVGRGVDTGPSRGGSAVVPAVTGNSMHALLLSARLREQGVNVQPIVYPAVADNAARLRFFLSSTHQDHELDDTAERVATTLTALRSEFPA